MFPHSVQIVSPIIVGRESELNMLEQAVHATAQGQGRCILIAGEAGVGKSRLLDEVLHRAARERFLVLQGQCFEQDLTFPYSLWINALRGFSDRSSASEIKKQFGPLAAAFVKLLPELALILPDTKAPPSLDPESEKRRLFEAVARFAARLSTATALLIALEDLHWSDETSLELLHTLIQRLAGRPILFLATYRNDEQSPQLSHFLAQVNRERVAGELDLAPLTRNQTMEMIDAIIKLERLPGDEFLDLVMQLTEGNPFFIEEVLKTLSEADNAEGSISAWQGQLAKDLPVPSSVHEAVRRRTDLLQPETRRILTLAAVLGQRFSLALLQLVSARGEQELLRALKELIAAQLVVEESADQFGFRHALTREAVYKSLLLRERQVLHRLIGETMEQYQETPITSHAAELAYHFLQAAVWDKALEYSLRAGEQAQEFYAPREALAHFSRALEAVERLNATPSASILSSRGHALELLGEFDAARGDYEKALESARRAEDREREWATLVDLGFLWQSRDWVRAGEYFERALDLARSLEETALIARSLNRIGNWHTNLGRPREGLSCHKQALKLFRALGDRRGTALTLELSGYDSYIRGDVIQGAAYCEQAVPILRELDDRQGTVNALTSLSLSPRFDTEVLGEVDLRHLASLSETASGIARSCDYRKGEADALTRGAICLCRAGEYGLGFEYLHRASSIAQEIEHRELTTTVHLAWGLELALGLLAFAEAREHLEAALAAARELGSVALVSMSTARLATACILQNDLERAQELLDAVVPAELPEAGEMTTLLRGYWAARAELELALGNPGRALEIVERLLVSTLNLAQYGPQAVPHLSRLRGQAVAALGRIEEAVAEFQGAQIVAQNQGQRPMQWRLHADLGKAYRVMSRREDAARNFSAARTIIQDLANSLPEGTLRANFLKEALASMPSAPALTPRRAAMKEFGGLTERERQVAALIAQGKSNRRIAQDLTLSERTVERHVSTILSKLDFQSRTQVAGWAVGRGLGK